jgi:hypothetical protein
VTAPADGNEPMPAPPPLPDLDELPGELPGEHPPEGEDGTAAGALLRTTAATGVIRPVPVVSLSGADIASGAGGPGPIALDDLSVTWGRGELMDQPTPATAQVSLFLPDRAWAAGRELIGQPLNLAFTAVKPGAGPVRQVFFRGRVTSAQLSRRSVLNTDGSTTDGALLELGASSVLTDLANRVPFEDWPEETLDARRARIAGWTAGVTSSVTVRTDWNGAHVLPVAAADQTSILDSLTGLFDSCGPDRMSYFPDDQRIYFMARREINTRSHSTQLWWNVTGDGTARDNTGAYIRSRAVTAGMYANSLAGLPQYLDAAAVEYDGKLAKEITSRITRVEISHKDSLSTPTAFAQRVETALVPGTNEAAQGVRSIRHESQVCWNNYAQTCASDLASMASREGAGWATGSVVYRADLAGGFESFDQVSLLLTGAETPPVVFLARSWFPELGIRPLFAVIGGQIGYAEGWSVECDLQAVSTFGNAQHALAWEEIDDGSATYQLEWHDTDHWRGLHESVTYEDMGFCGLGLAVSTTPTNTEWDQVYER